MLEKDPASQRVQAVAKAKEKDPAIHCMHVLEPGSLENFPTSHRLHAAWEVELEPKTMKSFKKSAKTREGN